MPAIGSETRTIRFKAEDLDRIEGVMKREDTSFNNAVHLLIAGTPLKIEKTNRGTPDNRPKNDNGVHPTEDFWGTPIGKSVKSVAEMADLMKVPTEKLFEDINGMLESGELYYSGGKLRNPIYEEFEDVCEEKKVNINNILMKVIRDIDNGK